MEFSSFHPSRASHQRTDAVPERCDTAPGVVAQQREFSETQPTVANSLGGSKADECSLVRSYSSANSSNSADASTMLSRDYWSSKSIQWPLGDMSSSASLRSSASPPRSELPPLARLDRTLPLSLESGAHPLTVASTVNCSLENSGRLLRATTCSAGLEPSAPTTRVQEQRNEKHEQQSRLPRDTGTCSNVKPGAGKCMDTDGTRSRDIPLKLESRRSMSDASGRAGTNDSETMVTTGSQASAPWRSAGKVENRTERSDSNWRDSQNETPCGKKLAPRKESSSLFSNEIEKAIANIASFSAPSAETDRKKNSEASFCGLNHFAVDAQKTSALLGAPPAGALHNDFPLCAGGSSSKKSQVTATGSASPAPEALQGAYGNPFLMPPDVVAQDCVRRPTSAPPTLSKFAASTLFAFPPCCPVDTPSAESYEELYHQIWRKSCDWSPVLPSSRENVCAAQKSRELSTGDSVLSAAAAAAAAVLQERQEGKTELQRVQRTAVASEQQQKNDQHNLAAAALKLAENKQLSAPHNGFRKGGNDDCVSLAVAAVAAALLKESQPSWRDETNKSQAIPANMVAGSASTPGEALSLMSASPTGDPDGFKDIDQHRLTSGLASDSTRETGSLQPTACAEAGAAAGKNGKQDFAVSLSVPHSPMGLSSLISTPRSSETPSYLSRRSVADGNTVTGAALSDAPGCIGTSARKCPPEPRLLHEHHRLLLSLPQESDVETEALKGCHSLGTTPRITVVKIGGEESTNASDGNKDRRLSTLDAAARYLVSGAAGSKAQLLLQQLESEEREIFRCASAPPGESAASLLYPSDFVRTVSTQAVTHCAGATHEDLSPAQEELAGEQRTNYSKPSSPCPEGIQPAQVVQSTLTAPLAEQEQGNRACTVGEEDGGPTFTRESLSKSGSSSNDVSLQSEPSTHHVGSASTCGDGTNAAEGQQQQERQEYASRGEPNEAIWQPFTAAGYPVNPWMHAPTLLGGGACGYPLLYNQPPSMIPGRQLCFPTATIPGCWEEDNAAFLVTRRAADAAGAMAAAYEPSLPYPGVILRHPPVFISFGPSVGTGIHHQAMRAPAGAFFLQPHSATARGDANEWTRNAGIHTHGRSAGGEVFHGGSGPCCSIGGMGAGNGYPFAGKYFPEDPLSAAATFTAVDSYNWARVNNFAGGSLGFPEGQSFARGHSDYSTAQPGSGTEELPKSQQLQQASPAWMSDGNNRSPNTLGGRERHAPEAFGSDISATLNQANRDGLQAAGRSTKGDKAVAELLEKSSTSIEDSDSRAGWTTQSCEWSGDKPAAAGDCHRAMGTGISAAKGYLCRAGGDAEHVRRRAATEITLSRDHFRGRVATLARDQVGCRMLQRHIEDAADPTDVQIIYEELLEDGAELMLDPSGNYLIQKLLEVAPEDQFRTYLMRAGPQLVKACLSAHGTRSVQKILEVIAKQADPRPSLKIFVEAIEPALPALVRDCNANHVIQKALSTLPPSYCDFIFNHVENHCVAICKERHGCCVVQRCIDAAGKALKERLLAIIGKNAVELVEDSFGNYVVQYVLDLQLPTATEAIMASLKGKLYSLSKQKFSSNVVEKCLIHGTSAQVRGIVEELLEGGEEQFGDLLLDQFGNYVVQRALTVLQPSEQEVLLRAISPWLPHLRRTTAGGCVAHRLIKRFPSLGSSPSLVHCACAVPGRSATSPNLVYETEEREATAVLTWATARPKSENTSQKPRLHPLSRRSDCLHSKRNVGATGAGRSGAQSRLLEERSEDGDYTWQDISKPCKGGAQQTGGVVQASSRQRQPDSGTVTRAPLSRRAGAQKGAMKRARGLASKHEHDKKGAVRSNIWAGGSALEVQRGHKDDGSCSGQPAAAEAKSPCTKNGEKWANDGGTAPPPGSKVYEAAGHKVDSWRTTEVAATLTEEHQPNGGPNTESATTAVPRAGRKPSNRRHNKHRAVKPLHVS